MKIQGDCVSGRLSRHYLRVRVSIPSVLVISSPSFEKGIALQCQILLHRNDYEMFGSRQKGVR